MAIIDPSKRAELEALLEYGLPTERQRMRILDVMTHGSATAAARVNGDRKGNYEQAIAQVKEKAARQGWSPVHGMTHSVPAPYLVKGVSTMYNAEGEQRAQWVKSQLKVEDKLEQVTKFAEELCAEVKGRAKKVKAPKIDTKDLLAVYPMGDPHLGMYSWGEETGEDFDTDVAVRDLVTATERLVDTSPACEKAVVLNLGDFFHADNQEGVTARSGHTLDTDTRWSRVMRMGAAAMRACIDHALTKHKTVTVRSCIGNHDDHTSHALSLILDAYYSNEPRVKVDTSPNPFWYYRFGRCLIAATHGHSVKAQELANIMAHDRPQDWGETEFRYWYLGHFHTQRVHEIASVVIEYFRTLAGKDAWTNANGYRSGRDMCSVILHKDYGQVERHRRDILMVRS